MTASNWSLRKNVFQHFSSAIWLLTVLDIFINISFSVALPFLALYLHNERALPMSIVGTIFLVGGLCTGATNLIGGMLSDRFGRRRLLLTISGISIFTYTALALLIGVSANLWLIIAVYLVARSINGTIGPTVSAIVADIAPSDKLAETYAFVRVGANVGFAIGPAAGGFLMGYLSYGWLLSISAIAALVVTAITLFFMRESFSGSKDRADLRSTLAVSKDRPFLVFIVCSILLMLSMAHLGSTLSVFTVDHLGFSTAQYGLLLTANGILVVVFQYPVTRLVSKLSHANGLILGSLLYVIGYSTLGWISSFNWAIFTIVLITAGEVTFAPISSAVVAESAPPDKRGRYMGFFALSQTVGHSLSPLLGGVMLDVFSAQPRLLWGIIGSVGLVAAVGFHLWGRMKRKPADSNAGLRF